MLLFVVAGRESLVWSWKEGADNCLPCVFIQCPLLAHAGLSAWDTVVSKTGPRHCGHLVRSAQMRKARPCALCALFS